MWLSPLHAEDILHSEIYKRCLFINDLQDKGYVTTYFILLIVMCYMFWKFLIGSVQHKVSLPFFIIYLLEV